MPALLLALFIFVASQPDRLRGVANPRATAGSWVADPARHLQPGTVATLDSMISAIERETSAEIAVVVLDDLEGLEPSQAALLLHRRWGVGKRERDNGIVFLWSPELRRTYVSIGYGLEGVLTDSRTGRIQDEHVIPYFRDGRFDEGVVAGVRALGQAARGETYSGLPRVAAGRPGPEGDSVSRRPRSFLAVGGALLSLGLVPFGVRAARRRWPRSCPRGHGRMRRLSESEEDPELQAVERLEETLGTMDYDVWVCTQCPERRILPYRRFTFRYRPCPQCSRRTCESRKKTVKAATSSSTGLARVTLHCKNCQFRETRTEVIPIVSESSGSSSGGGGGGSSFGGGSSGGGGAGRSY